MEKADMDIEVNTVDMRGLINDFWTSPIEYEKSSFSAETIKKIKLGLLFLLILFVFVFLTANLISFISFKIEENKFNHAVELFKSGDYTSSIQEFLVFDDKSDFYLKANVYIRKYKTAEDLFNSALKFYNNNDYDEALNTLSTIKIIVKNYPQADRLIQEINDIKEQQRYRSEELSEEGLKLLESGDMDNAYVKLEKAISLTENEGAKLKNLKTNLAKYAVEKVNEAQTLFNDGKITQASTVLEKISQKFPNFSRVSIVDKNIAKYYSAVEKISEAEKLFLENKFSQANSLFETAVKESPVILKTHSEILQKLKGNTLNRDFMTDEQKEFLDKLEISNVLYTENADQTGMILMFDIKNITDTPFEFRAYWCQAEAGENIYYPEPATSERYASTVKIKNGELNSEFEDDDLSIGADETYRVMYTFSGERELYVGAVFYYVDRTKEITVDGTDGEILGSLKIPLLQIE